MADNYLERKLEEHRAKQAARKKPARPGAAAGLKPGHIQVPFPPKRVLVIGEASPLRTSLIEHFRKTGSRVAFCGSDEKAGQLTAESTGSLFIPGSGNSPETISRCLLAAAKRWNGIDILICTAADSTAAEAACARFASHRATLAEPYSRFIAILHNQNRPENLPASIASATIQLTAPLPDVRTANPDDIARLCLFLCMEENDFLCPGEIRIAYACPQFGNIFVTSP